MAHTPHTWANGDVIAAAPLNQLETDLAAAADSASVAAAQAAAQAFAVQRGNHTGTQTSGTISDFTEAVQDAVASLLGAGSNVTLTYNDAANTLTVTAATTGGAGLDAEAVRDAIGVALVGVGNIAVTVNDAADTITISTTATVNSPDAQLRDRSTHTGTQPASTVTGLATVATSGAYADLTGKPATAGGTTVIAAGSLTPVPLTATTTAPIAADSFASGTALAGRTTPTGGFAWTNRTGTFTISSPGVLVPSANTDGYLATFPGGIGRCTVTAVVTPFGSGTNRSFPGLVLHYTDTSNYFYAFPITDDTAPKVQLRKVTAGVDTLLMEAPASIVSGTAVTLRVDLFGPDMTLFVNGTEIGTVTETQGVGVNTVGFRYGASGSAPISQFNSITVAPYQGTAYNWPRPIPLAANPLIPLGTSGAWDSTDLNNPNVVWDPVNARWVMYYSGYYNSGSDSGIQGMGIATADKLEGPWTKSPSNPVFTDSEAGQYNMNGGLVFWAGLWWHAYGSGGGTTISMATSPDLTTWTKRGTIITASGWEQNAVFDAFLRVRQDGATLELWYGSNVSGGNRGITYATSTDGLTWTKASTAAPYLPCPVFSDKTIFSEASVFVPSGREGQEMLVCCDVSAPSASSSRRIGQALTIDGGQTWHWRIISRNLGTTGWAANSTFDSFQMFHAGRYYLFSSGAPNAGTTLNMGIQIGLQSCDWNPSTLTLTAPGTLASGATTYQYQVVRYANGAYPARPAITVSPAGWVLYVGPVQPTDSLSGDEWVNNS